VVAAGLLTTLLTAGLLTTLLTAMLFCPGPCWRWVLSAGFCVVFSGFWVLFGMSTLLGC
jgi:hypothetical protein